MVAIVGDPPLGTLQAQNSSLAKYNEDVAFHRHGGYIPFRRWVITGGAPDETIAEDISSVRARMDLSCTTLLPG